MPKDDIEKVRDAWEKNAAWWDEYIGAEGNTFHRELIAPAQLRVLEVQSGERVLDIACGNGQFAREMARNGGSVLAFDFSATFIERAKQHSEKEGTTSIDYRVVDATDEQQLRSLGDHEFDVAVCTMALMDIPTIEPLLATLPSVLRPGGRFVFSVMHPCFNSMGAPLLAEEEVHEGELVAKYAVKVVSYLDVPAQRGEGIVGQPVPHVYFHRPLHELLGSCFEAGFVMDGIEEPAFSPDSKSNQSLGWRNYSQIPPVLVVRLRASAPLGSAQD